MKANVNDSRSCRELEVRYADIVWPTVFLDVDGVTSNGIPALIQHWDK